MSHISSPRSPPQALGGQLHSNDDSSSNMTAIKASCCLPEGPAPGASRVREGTTALPLTAEAPGHLDPSETAGPGPPLPSKAGAWTHNGRTSMWAGTSWATESHVLILEQKAKAEAADTWPRPHQGRRQAGSRLPPSPALLC